MKKRARQTNKQPRRSRTPPKAMDALDRALQDSFPASDPISFIEPTNKDEPKTRKPERKQRD